MNEVLGLFYTGLAKPLLPEDLLRCSNQNLDLMDGLQAPYESYMGVDWGGGKFAYTVVWIMAKDDKDCWRLIHVRKLDERDLMKQVEIVANLIPIFNVKQAVADIGFGAVQVSELQKRFGSRVMGCYYVRRPELALEQKNTDEYGRKIAQMIVHADRSYWIERAISLIKNKNEAGEYAPRLVLPWRRSDLVEWLVNHFVCIEMEEQETISGRRYHHYKHPEGEPDDALHAFVYALIAEETTRLPENQPLAIMDLFSGQRF